VPHFRILDDVSIISRGLKRSESAMTSPSIPRRRRIAPYLRSAATLLSLCVAAASAHAAETIVLGDSIGAGVAAAARLPRLARPSVSLRGEEIFDQLRRAPRGATVVLALGTNDAFDSPQSVAQKVDRILAAAGRADLRLAWIGPPCVRKAWNRRAQALDQRLRAHLAGRATYVSVIEPRFCEAKIKAPDGVHFTLRGYGLVWTEARAALLTQSSENTSVLMRTTLGEAYGAARE
jgi:hypothetical protein